MTDPQTAKDNVLEFRRLVDSDPALQAEVTRHVGAGTWDSTAIVEIGKAKGLSFTAQDLADVLTEDDELTDIELELVAAAAPVSCNNQGA